MESVDGVNAAENIKFVDLQYEHIQFALYMVSYSSPLDPASVYQQSSEHNHHLD